MSTDISKLNENKFSGWWEQVLRHKDESRALEAQLASLRLLDPDEHLSKTLGLFIYSTNLYQALLYNDEYDPGV
jgi:hypothetical protein